MAELEYLLEVRAAELPGPVIERLWRRFAGRLFEELVGLGLAPSSITTGLSPRRAVVILGGLPEAEADREERELGPPLQDAYDDDGEPTAALEGFAERLGLDPGELTTVKTEKGEYLTAVREIHGRATAEVLAELVPRLLRGSEAKRALAWGPGAAEWPVPLRSLVSLLGSEIVHFELAGVEAGRETAGHPTGSPESFEVEDAADHRRRLAELGLEVDPAKRRARIAEKAAEAAAELGGELHPSAEAALDRLALTCELPGLVSAKFDAGFLALPGELVVAALTATPPVLPLTADGELLPRCLVIVDRTDDPAGKVRKGWELAIAGRLAELRFDDRADRRRTLVELAAEFEDAEASGVPGTEGQRRERLRALTEICCDALGWEGERAAAVEAADLAKVDLKTAAVRRFGQLEGVVGGIYARDEGYALAVWQAIYDHPLPRHRGDPIPRGRAGRAVAVAERIDRLAGGFGSGRRPTPKKDPYDLRGTTHGLLRILLEGGLDLDLDLLAARAVRLYGDLLDETADEVLTELQAFLGRRLRHFFGDRGFDHDEIEAALAVRTDQLTDLAARLEALREVRGEEDFRSLVLAAKRISNILQDQNEYELDPELFAEEAEGELHQTTTAVRATVEAAVAGRRYGEALRTLVDLAPILDRFFVDVLVMDEDRRLRENRIALLQRVRRIFWRIARLREMAIERPEAEAS